ncbi:MAG: RNA methyltransferase [Bacteroidales bacterium]|nr:RNA methyltransferase [Bacteroidales bacterium]
MMQELSKAKISLISSLSLKKFRDEHNLFVAEGHKIVDEVLHSGLKIKYLIYNSDKSSDIKLGDFEVYFTPETTFKKISSLKTAPSVLAVVEIPECKIQIKNFEGKLTMAADSIQDPGNLGTLIRICDWFGIENLVCSHNSADLYNPKVIQATMGAFLRVKVHYVNLLDFIPQYILQTKLPCYGTFLDGENIYKTDLSHAGMFVLGNEGKGISAEVERLLNRRLFIPPFSQSQQHAESLNIASAASIVSSEFRRRFC